jgi:hypothetical protein
MSQYVTCSTVPRASRISVQLAVSLTDLPLNCLNSLSVGIEPLRPPGETSVREGERES